MTNPICMCARLLVLVTASACGRVAKEVVVAGTAQLVIEAGKVLLTDSRETSLESENCAKSYYNRGLAWEKKGDYDRAIEEYTRSIAIDSTCSYAYFLRGFAWKKTGDYDRAIEDFTRSISIDSTSPHTYFLRGSTWDDKGNDDRAIEDYTKVIEIDPTHESAYFYRGLAWKNKGRSSEAIRDFVKCLEYASDSTYYANTAPTHIAELRE